MICLIRPPFVESFRIAYLTVNLPLGLSYIAGALEAAGKTIHILDAVAEAPNTYTRYVKGFLIGLKLEDIAERIPSQATQVGITVIFTHEWPAAIQLIKLIKAKRPELKIILGGEHVTAMPEFCLAVSEADYIVLGEGEETIVSLVNLLENGDDPSDLKGIGYKVANRITINKRHTRECDINQIARPAWHLFDIKAYVDNNYVGGMQTGGISMPLLATRGCPYQCTFCAAPNMWTPSWFPRDPLLVVDEIEHYVKTYNAKDFTLQDLTVMLNRDWLITFCNELLARNLQITWQLPSGTRSEAIDSEVANLLYRTGAQNLNFAPESGSETTRMLIKKKMKTGRLMKSLKASIDAKLIVGIFTIIGFPHDKPEHLAENLKFVRQMGEIGVTDISVGFYLALPGSELFDSLYDDGKITIDRDYFVHILQGASFYPSKKFAEHLSNLDMFLWKIRCIFTFFKGRGLYRTFAGIAKGFFSKSHETRLATAISNGIQNAPKAIRVQFGEPWISRTEEDTMFSQWENVYREIRRQNMSAGIHVKTPADTTKLYKDNVINGINLSHNNVHHIQLDTTASS
ncbi:MAG: cobalamin B12-binding domain-containing protein [Rhodospirillaceae bacterium]|nr:cobalamin B12-binding domain-containing protein [Rhodospirillaceae bacterium]